MKAKRLALCGLLTALALVLSYLESLVPLGSLSFFVPGVKLGLPNLAILFALYRLGFKEAAVISLIRVLLVSLLFGNVFSLAYSAAGAALALAVMGLLRHSGKFGTAGVSVAGAVAHNVGQILVAMAVLETGAIAAYLPVLLLTGTAAGVAIGLVSAVLIDRVKV